MSRPISITDTVSGIPYEYNSSLQSGSISARTSTTSGVTSGLNPSSNNTVYALFTGTTQNSDGYAYYNFNFSGIPSNATITSVSASARGRTQSNNRGTFGFQLCTSASNLKGSEVTGNTTTSSAYTLTTGTNWTVSDIENLKLRIRLRRTASSTFGFRFYGATVTVNYSVNGTEYEVSFDNQSSDATTDPSTTQYVFQGGSQEIKIYVDDIDDIVVKDNNINVASQLVEGSTAATYTVDSVNGASYGFALNSNNYYESANKGVSKSAALCRVNLDLPTEATVTFSYINYAEASYDFGVFGNIDTPLSTAYYAAGSNGATITDTSYKKACNTSSDNTSSVQTLTYTIPAGEHYIDVKFSKDDASNANNDTLQFRVAISLNSTPEHYYQYTISNIAADHTISIEDAAGGTFYNVNASSTYNGATVSPSTQSIREGRSANVQIAVNNLYEIVVKDNGTTVTNSLVQNATGYTYTVSNVQAIHNITVEEATYYTVTTSSTYAGATATANPAKVYAGRGSVVDIEVDNLYEIVVKDNGTDVTSSIVEMQGGSTTSNFDPTQYVSSASSYDSIYNSYDPTSGVSNSGSTSRACVYSNTGSGAESKLTYKFDCSSIPENATITNVVCAVKCSVYQTSYFATRTVQLYHGDTAKGTATTITGTGSSGSVVNTNGGSWTREELNDIAIVQRVTRSTSNPTSDASFSFFGATLAITYTVPAGKTYTLTNVQADHTITIEEAPYYTITVNNSYQDASVTVDPSKGYYGIDVDVRIQVSDIDEIKVMDNGVSVMANIINVGSGLYRYTINAINTNHTITVTESTRYNITATSNYSEVTISPSSVSVIEGHSQTFVIEGDEDTDVGSDVTLLDNNVDVTSQMTRAMGETGTTSTVLGTFDSANSQYLDVYTNSSNVTYYETNAEGHGCDYGISNSGSTRSSFYPTTGAGSELIVFYNFSGITIPEGATITNVSAKAAVAPAYNGAGYTEMSLQLCIGTNPVGEATPISSASTDASEHTVDGGSGWTANDLANAKIKMYGVRNNTNSNNDSTGKRDNLNMCGADLIVTYSLPGGYLYTISNVQTAHTLVVNEVPATYYTVTASSSYQEATITPASQSVRQNHTAKLQISAASIYDIVVKDNGVNVTSELVQNETGFTYTTQKITAPHTITVEESESFAITTSSQYQGATISPATQSVRQGMSATTYVEVGNPDEIAVLDNSVDVTEQLVLTTPGESYTASGILSTFDTVNSQYVGIYSSYAYTNAEGHSAAEGIASTGSTRSAFYPATGAGSELFVYYDFGEVTGIPSDAVIYNVSANVAFSTAYSGQGYSDVTLQLCIGTTPVGEATHPEIGANTAPVSARTATVDGGSGWTLNDITNAKILLYGVRNDTNSNNDTGGTRDNLCMHGADIIVTYGDGNTFNGYTYTLNNVQTAHTIVIIENPQYTLTSASHVQGVTITPATATVYGRQDITFNISGELGEAVVLDNNINVTTQLRANATGRTYTISNVQSSHTIVVTEPSQESDYIKIAGQFKKVLGFYKKVNGVWTLIEKAAFDEQVSSGISFFGGVIENTVIGDVETSGGAINISINDGSLDSGSYKMVYEDVNRTPITGYTNINEFTIQ